MKKLSIVLTGLMLISPLLTAPLWSQEQAETKAAQAQLSLDDMRTFTDVFRQIRENYVETVDDKTLLDAAIRGMLADLDPHSSFLTEEEYNNLNNSSHGEYGGIGVELQVQENNIVVIAPIDDSPAQKAGLLSGDTIIKIDNKPVRHSVLQKAIRSLRGEPGSQVSLTVRRPGEKDLLDFNLTREIVRLPSVHGELLEEDFGYLRISKFQHDTDKNLNEVLDELLLEANNSISGLVLDLRSNPGGVLNSAVGVADTFLEEGLVTYTKGRGGDIGLEFKATPGQRLSGTPMVVLVDGGSASASEIVAGALQDHQRALVVGDLTFGKGSVQSVLPLRNGSAMKLTTSRYFTPKGRSIQAQGIEPDVVLEAVQVMKNRRSHPRESDLEGHLSNPNGVARTSKRQINGEDDYPLYQALNLLRGVQILSQNLSDTESR